MRVYQRTTKRQRPAVRIEYGKYLRKKNQNGNYVGARGSRMRGEGIMSVVFGVMSWVPIAPSTHMHKWSYYHYCDNDIIVHSYNSLAHRPCHP